MLTFLQPKNVAGVFEVLIIFKHFEPSRKPTEVTRKSSHFRKYISSNGSKSSFEPLERQMNLNEEVQVDFAQSSVIKCKGSLECWFRIMSDCACQYGASKKRTTL